MTTNTDTENYAEAANATKAGNAYFIRYSEDLWKAFSEEQQHFCKTFWLGRATPMGVEEVVLQLVPDELFPMYGKEKPYIEWRHRFPKTVNGEWTSTCKVDLCTQDHRDLLGREGQEQMRSYFSAYPKGTRFKVYNLYNKLLWEHTT